MADLELIHEGTVEPVRNPRGAGRPKGSPNKLGGEIQAMLKTSLSRAGGIDYLVQQSRENPAAYMSLIGKLLPRQLQAQVTHDGEILKSIEVVFRGSSSS